MRVKTARAFDLDEEKSDFRIEVASPIFVLPSRLKRIPLLRTGPSVYLHPYSSDKMMGLVVQ
jgi:hypothetical protein